MENDIKLGAEVDNNQERDNKKLELKIDGISCQACVAKIERKLSRTGGVEKALVNISNNMADIEYNEKEIKASEIMKIIEKLGYTPKRREDLKDKRFEEVDRTPAENLTYQVGWTTLLLKWEKDEKAGLEVHTPSENFKWNNLTELYRWFNKEYSHLALAELKSILNKNISDIYKMIDEMSEDELFKPHQRK